LDLSIIIVNWKSVQFLERCLATVFQNVTGDFEVIVVDNASFDGSAVLVQERFPKAQFMQLENNVGFAMANNLAFLRSKGKLALFLNPDTEIEGQAVQLMMKAFENLPNAGIVGCKLLNTDRTVQTSCIRAFPTVLNLLVDTDWLRKKFPRAKIWGMRPLFVEPEGPVAVDVVSGACLMARRDIFERIGHFSDDYFMYSEDVDLCHKVRQTGFSVNFVPNAVVIHHGGRSSDSAAKNNFAAVVMRESRFCFFQKTRGRTYAAMYLLTTAVAAVVRLVLLSLAMAITGGQYRRKPLGLALSKWMSILRWALGLETWVAEQTSKRRVSGSSA